MKPIYSRFNHEGNYWEFLLSDEDFNKVQQGYACGECLEDFQGEFRLKCPVCGFSTEAADRIIFKPPREWR
jgi:DNA-directed RNA polymerase subunit RPC12/RpoP